MARMVSSAIFLFKLLGFFIKQIYFILTNPRLSHCCDLICAHYHQHCSSLDGRRQPWQIGLDEPSTEETTLVNILKTNPHQKPSSSVHG